MVTEQQREFIEDVLVGMMENFTAALHRNGIEDTVGLVFLYLHKDSGDTASGAVVTNVDKKVAIVTMRESADKLETRLREEHEQQSDAQKN